MKSLVKLLIASSLVLSVFSCKKKETVPEEISTDTDNSQTKPLIKIGETYIYGANAKAVIYSDKTLESGYNELYTALFDSTDGSALTSGHFDITPMMDMGSMKHSAPVENDESGQAADGYFKSAVVFSMPGTASQWFLNFTFHNHKNNLEGEGSIGTAVIAASPSRFKTTILSLDSNTTVFMSLITRKKPQVGINDFELVLHKKKNAMEYEPIENYRVEITPEMPSMGHGSPNNVNPVHTGHGHYLGKVNFTMTGLWHIKLKLFKNDVLISSDQFFELSLN